MEIEKISPPKFEHTMTEMELEAIPTEGNRAMAKHLNVARQREQWMIERIVLLNNAYVDQMPLNRFVRNVLVVGAFLFGVLTLIATIAGIASFFK